MDPLVRLGEQRIDEAVARGELDDLPGHGRPLELEDLSHLPPEARSAFLILRNSGHLPEEMQLRKDMVELRDLLAACHDEARRRGLNEKLTARTLRYEILMQGRGVSPAYSEYAEAIRSKLDPAD